MTAVTFCFPSNHFVFSGLELPLASRGPALGRERSGQMLEALCLPHCSLSCWRCLLTGLEQLEHFALAAHSVRFRLEHPCLTISSLWGKFLPLLMRCQCNKTNDFVRPPSTRQAFNFPNSQIHNSLEHIVIYLFVSPSHTCRTFVSKQKLNLKILTFLYKTNTFLPSLMNNEIGSVWFILNEVKFPLMGLYVFCFVSKSLI